MRTIKFKGKSVDSSEWIEVYFYEECNNPFTVNDRQTKSMLEHNESALTDPDTICQFTGFLDKNGKEIYEGDVLRSDEYPFSYGDKERDNYHAVVYYCEKGACFGTVTVKNPNSSVRGISDGILDNVEREKMKNFEVIGNIHDTEWKQYREYVQDEDKEQHQ